MIVFSPFYINANVIIKGKLIREHQISPGEEYRENITLTNRSTIPKEIKIYQTDYIYSHQGISHYPQPAGQTERSNAKWISLNPSFLIIPPNEAATIHCHIQVPSDQSLQGTYWSMLMIEQIQTKSNSEIETNLQTIKSNQKDRDDSQLFIGVQQIMRYGIQIVTNIGDSGEKEITILDQKITSTKDQDDQGTVKEKETYILQMDIKNSGERWVHPIAWVEVYDQQGLLINTFSGSKYVIYPGHSVSYQIYLNLVPHQSYQALVILDNEDDDVWGTQYTLDL